MKNIIYFFQFIFISIFFVIFKLIGYKNASNLGCFLGKKLGPKFRSKKIIEENFRKFNPTIDDNKLKVLINEMWGNYGRIFAEYVFIPSFRKNKYEKFLKVEGLNNLNQIKLEKKPVVFISAHFSNFELMAMIIEREGIDLTAIYRPLNNKFLNVVMEYLRKKFICKKQIPKGLQGVKFSLANFKNGSSLAIMIDQRVSEGLDVKFFGKKAFTTTIPAQFVKKFNCKVQPVYIQRSKNHYFNIVFDEPISFEKSETIEDITSKLNLWLENKISLNPDQWIWTHNRWKH